MTESELLALKKQQFFTPIKSKHQCLNGAVPKPYGYDDPVPPAHMKHLLELYGTRKDQDDHVNQEDEE